MSKGGWSSLWSNRGSLFGLSRNGAGPIWCQVEWSLMGKMRSTMRCSEFTLFKQTRGACVPCVGHLLQQLLTTSRWHTFLKVFTVFPLLCFKLPLVPYYLPLVSSSIILDVQFGKVSRKPNAKIVTCGKRTHSRVHLYLTATESQGRVEVKQVSLKN